MEASLAGEAAGNSRAYRSATGVGACAHLINARRKTSLQSAPFSNTAFALRSKPVLVQSRTAPPRERSERPIHRHEKPLHRREFRQPLRLDSTRKRPDSRSTFPPRAGRTRGNERMVMALDSENEFQSQLNGAISTRTENGVAAGLIRSRTPAAELAGL